MTPEEQIIFESTTFVSHAQLRDFIANTTENEWDVFLGHLKSGKYRISEHDHGDGKKQALLETRGDDGVYRHTSWSDLRKNFQ